MALITLTIAACYVWIACDPWMQEAFVIYGRGFRAAVGLRAWGIMYRCGWRLSIIIALICATLWFAFDSLVLQANETTNTTKVTCVVLVLFAIALIPSRFAIVAIQHCRRIDSLVKDLSGTAQRIAATCDMTTTFDRAGYDNEEDWIAWHPSHAEYVAADQASVWRRIVPVFYTSPSRPGTVVIPIDWSHFAVWGGLPALPTIGEQLPFRGPQQTEFRLQSIRQLKSGPDRWILLSVDMDISDEDVADLLGV